jgi:hypothetical protein
MKNFLFLFLFSSIGALAQQPDSMLNVYEQKVPFQKSYVQFDKDVYKPGETIWFKAYVFEPDAPGVISKNYYAELLDNNGNIVQRKIYPMVESSAAGDFEIPSSASSAKLTFRGYTTWMLNFDSSLLYFKKIQVINPADKPQQAVTQQPRRVSTQFFPEGGDMVSSLPSTVAFLANDQNGNPANITGSVKDGHGVAVASFSSIHDGMGSVSLTPAAGEKYTATWTDEDGNTHTTDLPAARNSGAVIHLTSIVKGQEAYTIIKSDNAADLKYVNILGLFAQHVVYKARVPFDESGVNSGTIKTADLPSGILQVTVFDPAWKPLAERIVFVNNNNYNLTADVKGTQVNIAKRGENIIDVEIPDTLLSNLSVSITDARVTETPQQSIVTALLLTGDLKGNIHDPAYYFASQADSVSSALDLVMLTHGWRRYNWQEVAEHRLPTLKFPSDNALAIKAKVTGYNVASMIAGDEKIVAVVEGKDKSKKIVTLNKTGTDQFSSKPYTLYDTARVYYQFTKQKKLGDVATVAFSNGIYTGLGKAPLPVFPERTEVTQKQVKGTIALEEEKKKVDNEFATKMVKLKEVTITAKAKTKAQKLDEQYASGLFTGGDAVTFDLTDDNVSKSAVDIFSYLKGAVAGLSINDNDPSNIQVKWRNSKTALYLDETEVEPEELMGLSPASVAYIKVFRPPFFGSAGSGAGGAVAIYTRKGADVKPTPGKGLNNTLITGYAHPKQFYSPDYEIKLPEHDKGDYRATLLWRPYIFTDAGVRKVSLKFYNNDITSSFRLILEGVNEAGKLVHIEKVYGK